MRSKCVRGTIVLLTGLLSITDAHRAAAATRSRFEGLFKREKFDLNQRILLHLQRWADGLPARIVAFVSKPGAAAVASAVLVAVLIAALIFWRAMGHRRAAAWLERELAPLAVKLPATGRSWLFAIGYVVASVSLPLAMWLLLLFAAGLAGYPHPVFVVFADLLRAWTIYELAVGAIHEVTIRPLLDLPKEHAEYLYRFSRWLLFYWLGVGALIDAAPAFTVPADIAGLLETLFELTLIVLLTILFVRRSAIMSLFPQIPNRLYQRFVHAMDRAYPLVLVVTVATATLQWAGFRRLADFVWLRTWALVGLFVVTVAVHHALRIAFQRWILKEQPPGEDALNFYHSSVRLLDYCGFLVVILVALRFTGLDLPLGDILSRQFATIGRQPLSVLVLIEAAAIVAGFILLARLVRDYLEFRIYPALNVDPGAAHAIDTFIVYALAIIGAMLALEAVGLSISTIALFAGALGIGAGFGLQSVTNNLASGLTLIFSRALRKGDWVTVGETIGMVQEVGVRATRLRTRDDIEYLIPNSEFVSGKIVNWTRSSPSARIHIPLGVSYNADPARVRAMLEKIAADNANVQSYPAPEVWFMGFGDSSLNFELLIWMNVRETARHRVASEIYFAIFDAFKEAGIEIPFPQRDLHIRSADGLKALSSPPRLKRGS